MSVWLFVYIITITLHVTSKKCFALVARTISHSFAALTREISFLPLEHKIHIFSPLEIYICHESKTINSTMKYAPYLRRSPGYKSTCLVLMNFWALSLVIVERHPVDLIFI